MFVELFQDYLVFLLILAFIFKNYKVLIMIWNCKLCYSTDCDNETSKFCQFKKHQQQFFSFYIITYI